MDSGELSTSGLAQDILAAGENFLDWQDDIHEPFD